MGLSFIHAAGLCQRSVSRVVVPWELRPYLIASPKGLGPEKLVTLSLVTLINPQSASGKPTSLHFCVKAVFATGLATVVARARLLRDVTASWGRVITERCVMIGVGVRDVTRRDAEFTRPLLPVAPSTSQYISLIPTGHITSLCGLCFSKKSFGPFRGTEE
jgi:hypothetical protein